MIRKFTAPTDVEVFKALQNKGRISYRKVASITSLPETTAGYARYRLEKRELFDYRGIPRLDKFPELPLAIVGFEKPKKDSLKQIERKFCKKHEVRGLFTTDDSVLFILMHTSQTELSKLILKIEKTIGKHTTINLISPKVSKLDMTIPDHIVDSISSFKRDKAILGQFNNR